jgi:hypothetical protein
MVAPHRVRQPGHTDRSRSIESEPDQQRAQSGTGQLNDPAGVVAHLERPEYGDLHVPTVARSRDHIPAQSQVPRPIPSPGPTWQGCYRR